MIKRGVRWLIAASLALSCAPPMRANASRLVTARLPSLQTRPALRMAIDVSSVPEAELCSFNELNRPLCVASLRAAFEGGLANVIASLYEPSPTARALRLEFLVEKLSHRPTSLGPAGYRTSRVDLRWSARVTDAQGAEQLLMQGETQSPQPVTYDGQLDGPMGAMVGAVLETIANGLIARGLGT